MTIQTTSAGNRVSTGVIPASIIAFAGAVLLGVKAFGKNPKRIAFVVQLESGNVIKMGHDRCTATLRRAHRTRNLQLAHLSLNGVQIERVQRGTEDDDYEVQFQQAIEAISTIIHEAAGLVEQDPVLRELEGEARKRREVRRARGALHAVRWHAARTVRAVIDRMSVDEIRARIGLDTILNTEVCRSVLNS